MPVRIARRLCAPMLLLAALQPPVARPALAQPGTPDIQIRLDDRQFRAGGFEIGRVEPETGPSEILLPGQVVVPPTQLRVIAAPAAGLIESLFVAPDERVRAGQAVARLRSTELVEAQRLFLEAATGAELAQEKLRRDEELYRERVIAERRLIVTRAEATAAAAALDERTQLLNLLGLSDPEVAELRRTRRIQQGLTVTSPVSGVVLGRAATPGERVAQAAPLMTIGDLSTLWINIQVPLSRAPALEANARVLVPAQGAEGFVLRIGRTADAATQSVTAVAEMHRGADALRPGQAVTVALQLRGNGMPQYRVPAGSVVRHRERSWVFIRTPTGFTARPVTVLNETAQFTSIRGGLAPTDQIATRGLLALLAELSEADGG
ncbi:efflux RND transporter periplasmic adaptor subunit [Roseococcus sp. SDR]|uniref:efflux RND transporter periplasmic adaptor subunit n=1 Tax=Roseococcus sp. SDR TaxID=2835532 RepID=UPI001BD168B4|nr:efflux RND transporter periplasmic adaptor subunit [Roseococcus sp. SDR]MBS7790133.1 efflux RND transporter periplasmic adaptor subunit [Roseococcus sp. SDR]MBV1845447.1 efflux RND transporter periplasmic adaptor subunit [Roseococcus sp. SDR]